MFSLGGWSPQLPTGFRVPRSTWVRPPASLPRFRLRDSHPLWWPVPGPSTIAQVCNWPGCPRERPATPRPIARPWFRLQPFRSPLLRPSRLLSCPRGTEMFQFPRFASRPYLFSAGRAGITPPRFPHSDIPGSQPACGSPRLFAACHVLPRFSAPRHPPSALSSLTTTPSLAVLRSLLAWLLSSCSLFGCQRAGHRPR